MYRTIVVDDEENIRSFIGRTLELVGHVVAFAKRGEEALDMLRDNKYDLAVLDLNLGGKVDGLKVLEAIRWRWPETAVVILTGQGSLESAMAAIRDGVDIYLLKPVEPQQIRAAAEEAIEKRRHYFECRDKEQVNVEIESGPVYIDKQKLIAKVNGVDIHLTSREFDLLVYLVENAHRVVPAKELARVIGDFNPESEYEARGYIKWYIGQLRKKIDRDSSQPSLITNIREGGYRFVAPS